MYELRMGTDCFNTLFPQKKKNLLQYIWMILLNNISKNGATVLGFSSFLAQWQNVIDERSNSLLNRQSYLEVYNSELLTSN